MDDVSTAEPVRTDLPERHGEPWRDDEHARLVQRVRDGVATADIADEFDRTVSSIRGQVAKMLPVESDDDDLDKVTAFRELLAAEPDFDWRARLSARKSRRNRGKRTTPFDDEDLITIAEVLCGSADYHRIIAAETVLAEVDARGLWEKVVARRAHHLSRETDAAQLGDLRDLARRDLDDFRRSHLTTTEQRDDS